MSTDHSSINWTLLIAAWGAVTGTLSLGKMWWDSHYRYREPLYLTGNVDSSIEEFTITIRNRDPQDVTRIENIYQLRRQSWWTTKWYEFSEDQIFCANKRAHMPLEIAPRTAKTFLIKDEYFAKAALRAKDNNAEAVSFSIRAGSGYTFRLQPKINGRLQPK